MNISPVAAHSDNTIAILRTAVAELRKKGPSAYPYTAAGDIFRNLACVEDFNVCGRSFCGAATDWLYTYLPAHLKENLGLTSAVFKATSSVANGCFHHFNMVKIGGMNPVICDLTASQYFTRPMTSLGGHAFFIGTRRALREIVFTAQRNTWDEVRKAFPARGFRHLWDVDFLAYQDYDFRSALRDHLNKVAAAPCLCTESLYYPMEITWGDRRSRLLNVHSDEDVRVALSRACQEAGIVDLTEDRDPEIPNLVTALSVKNLSLGDGPW